MDNILSQDLLKELGLENLPEDKKTSLLLDIGRIIQQNIILRVLEELKEEDKDDFEKLLAEKINDQDAILAFLQSRISNLDVIVQEEIESFKKESLGLMNKATGR